MKKIFIFIALCQFSFAFSSDKSNFLFPITMHQLYSANSSAFDTSRLYNAMLKARRGDSITLAYIGGSITQGYAASTENKRWVNLVTEWWKERFPQAKIKLINAGIGGTGSDIGVFRVKNDVLKYNPDFVVVEFSVNDADGIWAKTTMEGLIRQILSYSTQTSVMMLMLKQANGTTAQNSHKPVGNHYMVPMVSFADLIDNQVNSDNINLNSIFVDGLHPNDIGMQYIAKFITDELNIIYNHLPTNDTLFPVISSLPDPLVGTTYDKTYMYFNTTIVPTINTGWINDKNGWSAKNPENEIVFEFEGNSIAILYSKHNNKQWGQAEVWVDNLPHKIFDAYWEQTWGPATVFGLVEGNLPDGNHTLHVRISPESPYGSSGHYFNLLSVLKAGNIVGAKPIAIPNVQSVKMLKDSTLTLHAYYSYDPDADSIIGTIFNVVEKPSNSLLNLEIINEKTVSFKPDLAGNYILGMQVYTDNDTSIMSKINIVVRNNNNKPIAVAGNDTTIKVNKSFYLNGSGSYDLDYDSLSFQWRIIEKPENAYISFPNPYKKETPIKVDREGTYKFGLIVNDGFEDSQEDTIILSATLTGINYNNNVSKINIYPNPAKNFIFIKISNQIISNVTVQLFSMDGKLVTTWTELHAVENILRLKLPDVLSGNYWLKIKTNQFETFLPLIKQ